MKTTLETSGEDVKTTLETSREDVKTTLETSGEDVKTTLETGGEDVSAVLMINLKKEIGLTLVKLDRATEAIEKFEQVRVNTTL